MQLFKLLELTIYLLFLVLIYLDILFLSSLYGIIKTAYKKKFKSEYYLKITEKQTTKKTFKIFSFYIIISYLVIYFLIILVGKTDLFYAPIFRIFFLAFSLIPYFETKNKDIRQLEYKIKETKKILSSKLIIYLIKLDNEYIESKIDFILTKQYNKINDLLPISYKEEIRTDFLRIIENFDIENFDNELIKSETLKFKNFSSDEKRNFIILLFQISTVDGKYSKNDDEFIRTVGKYLQINNKWFQYIKNKYVTSNEDFSKDYSFFENMSVTEKDENLQIAYQILGVTENSSSSEIKTAYRNLVKKNHPDKVAYLGNEFTEKSEELFIKIQNAYDLIAKEKNIY